MIIKIDTTFILKFLFFSGLSVATAFLVASNNNSAIAQNKSQRPVKKTVTTNNGISVHAGLISSKTYGLYLVDHKNKTIAVYKYNDRAKPDRLELRAVRSFKYDVQLDAYNTAKPSPTEIHDLVSQQKKFGVEK